MRGFLRFGVLDTGSLADLFPFIPFHPLRAQRQSIKGKRIDDQDCFLRMIFSFEDLMLVMRQGSLAHLNYDSACKSYSYLCTARNILVMQDASSIISPRSVLFYYSLFQTWRCAGGA